MRRGLIIIGLITALASFSHDSPAQCNTDTYNESCVGTLKDGFTFVKSFKVDGQGGAKDKVEYSYVFSKDMQYNFRLCADGENTDGIVVTIYDSSRKPIISNNINGKFYKSITYPCSVTGIYYISFTFEESQNFCGASVMGFKR